MQNSCTTEPTAQPRIIRRDPPQLYFGRAVVAEVDQADVLVARDLGGYCVLLFRLPHLAPIAVGPIFRRLEDATAAALAVAEAFEVRAHPGWLSAWMVFDR